MSLQSNHKEILLFAEELDKLNHVEKGHLNCGGATGWSKGSWGYKYLSSEFFRSYTKPPLVFTSVREWKARTDKPYIRIANWVNEVNTTHVTLGCHRGSNEGDLSYLYVNWISFPVPNLN